MIDSDSQLPTGETEFLGRQTGLSDRERLRLGRFRHPGRRDEFVAARRLAKSLLRRAGVIGGQTPDQTISILPAAGSSRPRLWVGHHQRGAEVSLSHLGGPSGQAPGGWVAAAVSTGPRVGIDLAWRDETASERLRPWFSIAERQLADAESLLLTDLWAMKEAAFKATSGTEPFRPDDFPVTADYGWAAGPCRVLLQPLDGLSLAIASPEAGLLRDRSRLWVDRRRIV